MQFDSTQNYIGHYFALEANSAGQAVIIDSPGNAPAVSYAKQAIFSAAGSDDLSPHLWVIPKMHQLK